MGVMEAVLQAQRLQKAAIEQTYTGKCTIEELQTVKDPITKRSTTKPVVTYEEIACRRSISNSPVLTESATASKTNQNIKLFLSPEIQVKSGSKVTVTQTGVTTEYKNSGIPALYFSHQEIELELFREWS